MSNWAGDMNMEEVTRMRTASPGKIRSLIMVTLLRAVRTQQGLSLISVVKYKKKKTQTTKISLKNAVGTHLAITCLHYSLLYSLFQERNKTSTWKPGKG